MSISDIISADFVAERSFRRHLRPPAVPQLPAITPGQLWLVEIAPDAPLSAPARHVFGSGNVLMYDRVLGDLVANELPLGAYAEPASEAALGVARGVHFARDGWSVARLLSARLAPRERTRRVQDVVDELAVARVPGRLPVQIVAEAPDGIEEHLSVRFDELTAVVARFPRETQLAIVIDAFGGGRLATRVHHIAANGLAG